MKLNWIIKVTLKSGRIIMVDNIHLHRSGGTLFLFSQNEFVKIEASEVENITVIKGEQNISEN